VRCSASPGAPYDAAAALELEGAAASFGATGSSGWAERARSELEASGHSNKQIAQGLFITINTVQGHLSHAYAKLGVTSRGQLRI